MLKFTPPSPLAAILGIIFTALIAIAAAVIFSFQPYVVAPTEFNPSPTPESPFLEPNSASCSQFTGEEVQTCCETWAENEGVLRALCLGDWAIENQQCSWQCSENPLEE